MSTPDHTVFDITGPLPSGRTVLEASAGTGKTYSLTALIARFIAERGTAVDQILVVTFTRAAANELRERTRESLSLAAQALAGTNQSARKHTWIAALSGTETDPISADERLTRERRLTEAITRFDELTITTIHGFCQQALGQLGLRAGGDPDAKLVENIADIVREVCRDVLVTELANDPTALSPRKPNSKPKDLLTPSKVETELFDAVTAVLSNPGSRLIPDSGLNVMAQRWAALVQRTCELIKQRQSARGEVGYDAIIAGLHSAIIQPQTGAAVAEQLAQRYSVVLVDEFQDTDRLQWDVFSRAFARGVLVTVGDPKQAIYRFRGADVHAYLRAVEESPALNLSVNHRSDQQLIAGLGHLFDGATLGDPRIAFSPVTAAPSAPVNALGDGPSIQLRVVPQHADLISADGSHLAMPKVRQLVINDLVAHSIDLLDNDTITTMRADETIVTRHVRPGDIAVLVPSHAEAQNVAAALRRSGIPAVRTRTGSVLQTPAVTQWRLLLTAVARPHQVSTVRAAALGWFLPTDPLDLCGETADAVLAGLQERVAVMADRLHRHGLAAFYDEQKSHSSLLTTLLARSDGDRHLTDLDHIAEILTSALHGNSCEPTQVLRVLDEMIAVDDDLSEATMRRIDSDAKAVQITTIHSAKGLEYPIVLVPFGFKSRANLRRPYSFTDNDGYRTLDIASVVPWDDGPLIAGDKTTAQDQRARKRHATGDTDGDGLRLLYVALTRAQHRLEVWWAATKKANTSALARVLLDRSGDGPVENTQPHVYLGPRGGLKVDDPPYESTTADAAIAQIHDLAHTSDGAIAVHELPERIDPTRWAGHETSAEAHLATASTRGRGPLADPAWKRWSFTRLSAAIDAHANGPHLEWNLPGADARGGADEPSSSADGTLITTPTPPASATESASADLLVAHLAQVAAGTTFGTFVHAVLEELDFTTSDITGDLRLLVRVHMQRAGLSLDPAPIISGLIAALHTPLGALFDHRSLRDFSPADRLAELTFDMALNGGVAGPHGNLPTRAIAEILLDTLPTNDALRPFAAQLGAQTAPITIAGWMNGSIDAVLRVPHGNDHRYLVIDYKTNRLHQPGTPDAVAAYHPTLLVQAMSEHRYPLQALLYSVAVHRYLRWRLGDSYDPDQHLGGIGYLFVRGMVGPNTPTVDGVAHGVFSWKPPSATVSALDDLFAMGSRS